MADEREQPEILYSWDAKEYIQPERNTVWYWWAAVIALIVIVYAVAIRQWTLIVVMVVAGVAIYLVNRTEPRTFTHTLLDAGIMVGDKLYLYTSLKSFWFTRGAGNQELKVLQAGKLKPLLSLQVGGADVEKIRSVLVRFIPEEEGRGEDVVDKISRFLKF